VIARRAGEIMIPIESYPYVQHTATVLEAVVVMEKASLEVHGRRSLPRALIVFDADFNALGIVRRRDILRALEPKFLRTMPMPRRKMLFEIDTADDANLVEFSTGRITRAMREQAHGPVVDAMRPISATVDYEDHLAKIVYKMLTQDLNLLPVLKDRRVVGVVRSVDVFHEVADTLLQPENDD
jgi:predicted transcriptional regulator